MKTSGLLNYKMTLNRIQKSIVFFVSVLTIIILTSEAGYSQNTKELKQTIQLLEKSTTSMDKVHAEKFNKLVYDIQPTVYITSREAKTFIDGNPIVGDLDISEISKLYSNNSIFENIELLKIRVHKPEQANTKLNIPLLAHLKSLKYVQFVFSYNAPSSNIDGLYVPDARVSVFYSIELPE